MKRFVLLLLIVAFAKTINAQQWVIEYPTEDYEEVSFIHGDKSLTYDYAVGRYENNQTNESYPIALCVDENGDYIDKIFYMESKKSVFSSVLGLDDGNVFVTAPYVENNDSDLYNKLWVAILNPNLEIVEENYIELEEPYLSFSTSTMHALFNDDKEIVVATLVADSIPEHTSIIYDYSFYKFDIHCNLLKQSYLENLSRQCKIDDFTLIPDKDIYAVFGYGMEVSGMANVIYIDNDLNYKSMSFLDEQQVYPDLMLPYRMSVGHWYDENHFLMSAQTVQTGGLNNWKPFVVKMDTEMNVVKTLDLERADTTDYVAEYESMAYVSSDVIYVSTFWNRGSFLDFLPNTMTVFLVNENLDLLGRKTMSFDDYYFYVLHVHPSYDGSCIVQGVVLGEDNNRSVIYKFRKEDMEIITDVTESYDDLKINCSPNPVSSCLNISVESVVNKDARILLFDMMGRRYLEKDIVLDGNVLSLDVSSLPEGTYFYNIIVDGKNEIKEKFVKK